MKSGVEREDSLWERKSVLVTILAVSIKKKKKKALKPCILQNHKLCHGYKEKEA